MISTTSKKKILLLTPPFVQLNTPYPATAYLKGFLNTLNYESFQADLGIEVILAVFSKKGLTKLFEKIENGPLSISENSQRILTLKDDYIATIDPTIRFLQHKNPTLALAIADRHYLPEAARFAQLDDLDWAFGLMGTHDKARHYATLYLEDLGDLIAELIDDNFGFSRYAERLGRTATHFEPIDKALSAPNSYISDILVELLEKKIQHAQPDVVCLTVPFPGNVFGAFKIGQHIKAQYPDIQIIMGGGYCNTELRTLSDERVFDYIDFICLDDGELPLKLLLEHLEGQRDHTQLKRVFTKYGGVTTYFNNAIEKDIPQRETGTPDYSDLQLTEYLSVIEIANPMHRLWSDGRWNKITLAHGCYWGKCTFCDISLDYIGRYEPINAAILCDRIETIIAQTGETGFHFVDEAAPPALMRDVAIEIIRRKITVTWWTNIRFEKSFTPDLCRLLRAAGCIAVSGGLEVASDRLLTLMEKGVTVAQVARVAAAFTEAGIMVHAYLMYGFPTQTAQETVDSLENVRQLFQSGVIQSGFWHQFAMTSHSPVGLNPSKYGVIKTGPEFGGFADNDLFHDDPKGADHELFSAGLKKSLFNYMHEVGFDLPLSKWFDFKVPRTTVKPDFIEKALADTTERQLKANNFVIWLANAPVIKKPTTKKKRAEDLSFLVFSDKKAVFELQTGHDTAEWLQGFLPKLRLNSDNSLVSLQAFKAAFATANFEDFDNFEQFLESFTWAQLREMGLLLV
jgi:hypothetical protein